MCPPYNIEILEDVGRAFGASVLDLIGDNPVSRLPLSRFKNLEGVRSDVSQTLNKSTVTARVPRAVYSNNKPPLKVKVKKGSMKANNSKAASSSNMSKANLKPGLKKATSMPVKGKKNIRKQNSEVSRIPPRMVSKKSSIGKVGVSVPRKKSNLVLEYATPHKGKVKPESGVHCKLLINS